MAHILVIDDTPETVEPLILYLRRLGHRVEHRASAAEALSAMVIEIPEAIVLDLVMPQMDGAELLELIRSYRRFANLPVVVLTALTNTPLMERAKRFKANAILIKGRATLEEVARSLESAISKSRKSNGRKGEPDAIQ